MGIGQPVVALFQAREWSARQVGEKNPGQVAFLAEGVGVFNCVSDLLVWIGDIEFVRIVTRKTGKGVRQVYLVYGLEVFPLDILKSVLPELFLIFVTVQAGKVLFSRPVWVGKEWPREGMAVQAIHIRVIRTAIFFRLDHQIFVSPQIRYHVHKPCCVGVATKTV